MINIREISQLISSREINVLNGGSEIQDWVEKIVALFDEYYQEASSPRLEILMEIYDYFQLLDANITLDILVNGNIKQDQHILNAVAKRYIEFHSAMENTLSQEFARYFVDFRDSIAVNDWDIHLIQQACDLTHEHLNLLSRFINCLDHAFLFELLSNTEMAVSEDEKYQRLSQIKRSLRRLLLSTTMNQDELAEIRDIIARINSLIQGTGQEVDKITVFRDVSSQILAFLHREELLIYKEQLTHVKIGQLSEHNYCSIQILSQANTHNYLISDKNMGHRYVLRFSPDMGNAPQASLYTQHKPLQQYFVKQVGPTTRHIKMGDKYYSASLVEFCGGGSLESILLDDNTSFETKIDLLIQVIDILQALERFKLIMPDIKLSNFLINNEGRVVISDDKSILYCPRRQVSFASRQQCSLLLNQNWITTQGFMVPEKSALHFTGVESSAQTSIHAYHSYLFGLLLYACFAQQRDSRMTENFASIKRGHLDTIDFDALELPANSYGVIKKLIAKLLPNSRYGRIELSVVKRELQSLIQSYAVTSTGMSTVDDNTEAEVGCNSNEVNSRRLFGQVLSAIKIALVKSEFKLISKTLPAMSTLFSQYRPLASAKQLGMLSDDDIINDWQLLTSE